MCFKTTAIFESHITLIGLDQRGREVWVYKKKNSNPCTNSMILWFKLSPPIINLKLKYYIYINDVELN